jgi:exo-beta-1,3-glucanase (GH17 family)/cellulose synthase/poly-beta-1,6-N-acetylglucosamine synthase-like glycosyltransferase
VARHRATGMQYTRCLAYFGGCKVNATRTSSLILLFLILLANFGVWALLNRPVTPADWSGQQIRGLSFSPFQKDQDPQQGRFPSRADIDQDLARLAGWVRNIRTYSSLDGLELIPQLAAHYGLTVTAGAWLDRRNERNQLELASLIRNARSYGDIDRLIVGNEVLLRDDMSVQELIGHLRRVKHETHLPVSTAEPWHVWLEHPELVRAVSFIAVHLLPYWEGVPTGQALTQVMHRYHELRNAYPDKPILIAEVGWPSAGNRTMAAEASRTSQAAFVRDFLQLAEHERLDYFLMEAYDQPWKADLEGPAGSHWGLFTTDRNLKYPLTGPVHEYPGWPTQAKVSLVVALMPLLWFLLRWRNIRTPGRMMFALLIQTTASLVTWSLYLPENLDLNPWAWLAWAILLPAQLLLLLVMLVNGFELTELLWRRRLKLRAPRTAPRDAANLPLVSLHLAICNEPPEVVMETLDSLAALDYPRLEVLVVDNNTRDPAVWQPVQAHCERLGSRFRFFSLGKWPGFKAGALNFALRETDPQAEVIGVIDSDYQVRTDWLRRLVPYFQRPQVGFVQAPQDNRGWEHDRFKSMINWEYAGFFHIGMVHRDQRNAIIQHGTMTLIRRAALQGMGGWAEWCICEDAELGLRLMQQGYESVYVNEPLGRGLTPESFTGYKRQRFRWVYGAVQILKAHWRSLLLPWKRSNLTNAQRYHFVAGWLPWFGDALHLLFTCMALGWTMGLVMGPQYFGFPFAIFLLPTLGMFLFKMVHAWFLYRAKVGCTVAQRLGAALAGMALTHVIARGVIKGLLTKGTPFLRTPKAEDKPAFLQGVLMAGEELAMLVLLWGGALAIVACFGFDHPEAMLWAGVLLVQSSPYLAAMSLSLINVFPATRPAAARRSIPVALELPVRGVR